MDWKVGHSNQRDYPLCLTRDLLGFYQNLTKNFVDIDEFILNLGGKVKVKGPLEFNQWRSRLQALTNGHYCLLGPGQLTEHYEQPSGS